MMPHLPPLSFNEHRNRKFALGAFFTVLTALAATKAAGQDRWFEIETSVFTNESRLGRDAETWLPNQSELNFPNKIRSLRKIQDSLLVEAFLTPEADSDVDSTLLDEESLLRQRILGVGPEPEAKTSKFRLFDLQRDEYLDLPASLSDFNQTNRALERSPNHQLLFHGHWRQRVVGTDEATSIYIEASQESNSQQALNGSLTIRFNEQEDRVVVDANLWLIEATDASVHGNEWILPEPPEALVDLTNIADQSARNFDGMFRVYPMQQSREMRSNEFHYLDHPALGLIIAVRPYNPPVD